MATALHALPRVYLCEVALAPTRPCMAAVVTGGRQTLNFSLLASVRHCSAKTASSDPLAAVASGTVYRAGASVQVCVSVCVCVCVGCSLCVCVCMGTCKYNFCVFVCAHCCCLLAQRLGKSTASLAATTERLRKSKVFRFSSFFMKTTPLAHDDGAAVDRLSPCLVPCA